MEKVLRRPFVLNKKAYAKTSIRNKFFDEFKRKEVLHEDLPEENSFDFLEDQTVSRDQLVKLLDTLQPAERELLYMWAVEGKTLDDIAKHTNSPRGTWTSRLSRLKKKLASIKGAMDE
jgi:RNA polymerase sigma-70 factor (ECF subfamily)